MEHGNKQKFVMHRDRGTERLECVDFDDTVISGTFTRHGGVSPAPFDSLNVGLRVGDEKERVHENRGRLRAALGGMAVAAARQVHADAVWAVDDAPPPTDEVAACDALITDVPGIALMIQQADCQAVMLHDPEKQAVGIAHAGWRGSALNIVARMVAALQQRYGSRPEAIQAAISPSLGPCCAEFVNYRQELPPELHGYQVEPNHFDFWAISRDQLLAAGLQPGRIAVAGVCTRCQHDYFSFRRERVTGRFASVIGLRP